MTRGPYIPPKVATVLDYRHCRECRTQFAVHSTSQRILCDDCEAAVNPSFARQLAERRAWQRDNANNGY
jgi:hypothetical protein